MHKLVQAFTNFMDSTAELARRRGESAGLRLSGTGEMRAHGRLD